MNNGYTKHMKRLLLFVGLLFGAALLLNFFSHKNNPSKPKIPSVFEPKGSQQAEEVIASNLKIPWEVAFLPDGEMLVTERPGNLLKIRDKTIIPIEGVEHKGEGGLLGLAVHPDFNKNHWIYLYHTTQAGNGLANVVERYKLETNRLTEKKVILSGIVGAFNHDGGRIRFGPDGYLYVTTGDAENFKFAQNTKSLNGKILRIKDDGSIPSDNPFGSAIYSYGHRNAQGLAWDESGQLFATEHGRSFPVSGLDELNKIEKGRNYGWPVIQGDQQKPGMVTSLLNSGQDTWAPAGAAYYKGRIFFGGLRGEALYEYTISDNSLKTHLKNKYGRLRAVVLGPDNNLYITTSNTDGRGLPKEGDDKLIRIDPESLH